MPDQVKTEILGPLGEPLAYPCAICGAVGRGEPAHGWRKPCPQKVAIDEAYIAMLDAQRMSYIRGPVANDEMLGLLRKIVGEDNDD